MPPPVIIDTVRLKNARFTAELHDDRKLAFLRLYSPRLPGRDMLLPLREEPVCAAMACFTPLGRLHALYWSLACGYAEAFPSEVSFSSPDRPYHPFRQARAADLVLLGNGWWLADVDGLFSSVAVRCGAATTAEVAIAPARRG